MQIIKCSEDIKTLTDNRIIGGENIIFDRSEIRFSGRDNVLYCEEGVKLVSTQLKFSGDGCLIYLSKSGHEYRLDATVYKNSVLYFGENNYFNGTVHMILSEQKNIFVGRGNLLSFGVWMRTADPHLIYDAETMKRINPSKSIFVGDHVWLGQECMLLKGTQLHSGSIVGARALVAGKEIPSNESWGGNPAVKIADGIFWDKACVHSFDDEKTAQHEVFTSKKYIFEHKKDEFIPFESIDERLTEIGVDEKIEYLRNLSNVRNRFSFNGKKERKKLFG